MELDNKFGFKVHLFCLLNRSVAQRVAQNDPEKSCRAGGKIVQKKTPDLSIKKKRCYINGFCQSSPIRSKIAGEQELIHSCYQKKSELSTPNTFGDTSI